MPKAGAYAVAVAPSPVARTAVPALPVTLQQAGELQCARGHQLHFRIRVTLNTLSNAVPCVSAQASGLVSGNERRFAPRHTAFGLVCYQVLQSRWCGHTILTGAHRTHRYTYGSARQQRTMHWDTGNTVSGLLPASLPAYPQLSHSYPAPAVHNAASVSRPLHAQLSDHPQLRHSYGRCPKPKRIPCPCNLLTKKKSTVTKPYTLSASPGPIPLACKTQCRALPYRQRT